MSSLLVTKDLRYRYATGFEAGPLTLDVGPGLIHLHGPNGSGKTTILRCLCGGLRRSVGTVEVVGADPRTSVEARRDVAYLPAEPELPEFLTVDEAWQQLAALRRRPHWLGHALRGRFGLPGALRLGQCSAGQRRLAELIAAVAGDPKVLLLDEPFANLDDARTETLCTVLEEWSADRVVVMTSHLSLPLPVTRVSLEAA